MVSSHRHNIVTEYHCRSQCSRLQITQRRVGRWKSDGTASSPPATRRGVVTKAKPSVIKRLSISTTTVESAVIRKVKMHNSVGAWAQTADYEVSPPILRGDPKMSL